METALAILMVLGIYIGIPVAIGFAIGGVYIMSSRRARRAERATAPTTAETEELTRETVRI